MNAQIIETTVECLRGLVKRTAPAIAKFRHVPSLRHIMLEANGKLRAFATDLTTVVMAESAHQIAVARRDNPEELAKIHFDNIHKLVEAAERPATMLAPADWLKSSLSKRADGNLTIQSDGVGVELIFGDGTRSATQTLDVNEFPAPPSFDENAAQRFQVGAASLGRILRQVLPFVADDDSRAVLGGVMFSVRDGRLFVGATDGRRAAHLSMPLASDDIRPFVIPARSLKIFLTNIGRKSAGDVIISTDTCSAVLSYSDSSGFPGNSTHTAARLLEGRFPDFEAIAPPSFRHEVSIKTRALVQLLGTRAQEVPFDALRAARIESFDDRSAVVTMHYNDPHKDYDSSAYVSSKIGTDVPFPFPITLNAVYFKALLESAITGGMDEVRLYLNDSLSMVVVPHEDDDVQGRYMLMPIRTKDLKMEQPVRVGPSRGDVLCELKRLAAERSVVVDLDRITWKDRSCSPDRMAQVIELSLEVARGKRKAFVFIPPFNYDKILAAITVGKKTVHPPAPVVPPYPFPDHPTADGKEVRADLLQLFKHATSKRWQPVDFVDNIMAYYDRLKALRSRKSSSQPSAGTRRPDLSAAALREAERAGTLTDEQREVLEKRREAGRKAAATARRNGTR